MRWRDPRCGRCCSAGATKPRSTRLGLGISVWRGGGRQAAAAAAAAAAAGGWQAFRAGDGTTVVKIANCLLANHSTLHAVPLCMLQCDLVESECSHAAADTGDPLAAGDEEVVRTVVAVACDGACLPQGRQDASVSCIAVVTPLAPCCAPPLPRLLSHPRVPATARPPPPPPPPHTHTHPSSRTSVDPLGALGRRPLPRRRPPGGPAAGRQVGQRVRRARRGSGRRRRLRGGAGGSAPQAGAGGVPRPGLRRGSSAGRRVLWGQPAAGDR